MPAVLSSPTSAVLDHLAELPPSDRDVLAGGLPLLVDYLAWVPDPRDPRGVRHGLVSLLSASIAASLTGATSFAAISEWIADAPVAVLTALGIRWNPLRHRHEIPDESTVRDLLEAVDATTFAAACGSWLTDLTAEREQAGEQQDGPLHNPVSRSVGGRRHVAVDGKALRGTRHGNATGRAAHVLTAVTARTMGLLAQTEVDGKSNEITAFAPLLAPLDLAGVVVTVDALHTQREHATFLVENKRAHYILVVKKNQLNLYRQVKGLLWRQAPIMHSEDHHGHGRSERRQLKVLTMRSGIAFPYAAQAIAIIRKTRPRHGGRWKTVTVYAITSLATHQAGPAELAAWIRAHWQVEALHHVKDVTYREDSSRIRTGNGPAVMSALRTLAIGLLKAAGATNIAKVNRDHARQAHRCLATLGIT